MSFVTQYKPANFQNTKLFNPIKIGDIELSHRVVMAPMTRMRALPPNHVPRSSWVKEYYEQRAQHKGTLIISEATFVSKTASGYDHAPGIWSAEQVEAWKPVIKAIHDKESFFFVQLWALGWQASPASLKQAGLKLLAPSASPFMDERQEKAAKENDMVQSEITKDEIKTLVMDYVNAAKNSLEAGADGVEIHAANGYLLNEFLDPHSNRRTDEYGGSIENRARFTLEVVDALIAAVGSSKVAIRLSPWNHYGSMSGSEDPTLLAVYAYVIGELEKRAQEGNRLAYIHLLEPEANEPFKDASNDFANSIWQGNFIRTGDMINKADQIKEIVDNGRTLIGYGIPFIANPDLVYRLENSLPITQAKTETFFTREEDGYTDYPNYEEALKAGYK